MRSTYEEWVKNRRANEYRLLFTCTEILQQQSTGGIVFPLQLPSLILKVFDRVASSGLGNKWSFWLLEPKEGGVWGEDELQGVYCHRVHLPKQPVSPGELISVTWRSVVIPGDLQPQPGG